MGWLEYDRFLLGQKADLEGRTVDGRGLGICGPMFHIWAWGFFKKQKLYCEAPYCLSCFPSQDAGSWQRFQVYFGIPDPKNIARHPGKGVVLPNILSTSRWFLRIICEESPKHKSIYHGLSPLPVIVTTRIITFLVGNPYKPSFPLLLGGGTTQHIPNHVRPREV